MSDNTVVRVVLNKKTGEMEVKVVGHENNASCSISDDHDIISKIANNIGKITEEDNTEEYYDEIYENKVYSGYNKENDKENEEEDSKKIDSKTNLGFGV